MAKKITTEILGDHPALLSIQTDGPLSTSWVRSGEGLVGFGVYAEKSVSGPTRFQDAKRWWHEQLSSFTIENNVHGIGTGPILFTSFTFLESDESRLVIPQIIVGKKAGKSWITWIGDQLQPRLTELPELKIAPSLQYAQGGLSDEMWQDQVQSAVARIDAGQVEKVVLARDLKITSNRKLHAQHILQRLQAEYPSTWLFAVDHLVGATPELLVRLNKSLVTSRVLAGTIQKTGDEAKDLALAGSLAKSSKDLEEHEYAVRSVAEALSPFCSSTNVPESPFVLHLANVMHLATDVTGVLNESVNHSDIFGLIAALHPSAAVCGTPTKSARKLIIELEKMNRGRYSGPVGWIDARGDGEVGIALRCGQISPDELSIRIFAGCGIVSGSTAADELAESQAKLAPMRTALATL